MKKPISEQELKQLCNEVAQQASYIKQHLEAADSEKTAVWRELFRRLQR